MTKPKMRMAKPKNYYVRQYSFSATYREFSIDGKRLRYVTSSVTSRWRVRTLFTKEPTTIVWLDTFLPEEVFVDIGANVGMYSLYAAAVRGARVYAFEPESQNYAELNRNIHINGLHSLVTALPLAISNTEEVSALRLSRFGTGWGEHNVASPVSGGTAFEQGTVTSSLDRLIDTGAVAQPHHIKVDVDGIEWRVFEGMRKTLNSPQLKSVLIETNFKLPRSVAIIEQMKQMGWRFSKDQARINQHEIVPYEEIERRIRAGSGGQNFIYYRDPALDNLFADYAAIFVPPNPIRSTLWMHVRPVLGRVKRRFERLVFRPL
jgi:FkbM family methyltransferase